MSQTIADAIAACEYRIKVLRKRANKANDRAAAKRLEVELARREALEQEWATAVVTA